jgi:4a-hydroxytetrahydrobiopterin dehydratase
MSAASPKKVEREVPELWNLVRPNQHNDEAHLSIRLNFENFLQAFAFATQVALLAEKRKHHPDMTIGYNYVSMELTTHAAGMKLTPADYKLAEEINQLPEMQKRLPKPVPPLVTALIITEEQAAVRAALDAAVAYATKHDVMTGPFRYVERLVRSSNGWQQYFRVSFKHITLWVEEDGTVSDSQFWEDAKNV